MPGPELLISAFTLCMIVALVALYTLYSDLVGQFSTQMDLALTPKEGRRLVAFDDVPDGAGSLRQNPLEGFDVLKAWTAINAWPDRTAVPPNASHLANADTGRFGPAWVFATDVELSESSAFHVPVKVAGDLTIDGHVAFHDTLVVDGVLLVRGHAEFLGGALVRGEVIVDGLVTVDARSRNTWLIGHRLRGAGVLAYSTTKQTDDVLEVMA